MESKENQKKLKKIRRIMNLCCDESLSVERYTIEECSVEDGIHLLMFVYNAKNEIIEARISSYDSMVDIAKKIRCKTQIHISQCNAIARLVAEKYNTSCIVEVLHYRNDILKAVLHFDRSVEIVKGTFHDIMNGLISGKYENR